MCVHEDVQGQAVTSVGVRELGRRASAVVDEVERGASVLVTKRGRVVAIIQPVDGQAVEDYVLANAPEFVGDIADAERALREGETRSLDDVIADLD